MKSIGKPKEYGKKTTGKGAAKPVTKVKDNRQCDRCGTHDAKKNTLKY